MERTQKRSEKTVRGKTTFQRQQSDRKGRGKTMARKNRNDQTSRSGGLTLLGVHVRHRLFLGDLSAPQASSLSSHAVNSTNCSSLIPKIFLYSSLRYDSYTEHRISSAHLPLSHRHTSSINGRHLGKKSESSAVHTTKYIVYTIANNWRQICKIIAIFRVQRLDRQLIPNM